MAKNEMLNINPVAHVRSDFQEKFGIPRQSGLARTQAEVILEPEYSDPDTVRGLKSFSHIWLIWGFSANQGKEWHTTVRPPRLGGNTRVGVFASRSPFRPNGLGLSCVRLLSVRFPEENGAAASCGGSSPNSNINISSVSSEVSSVEERHVDECLADKWQIDGRQIILTVEGADLMDGTPVYDIKPYIPYADCIPDAIGGYTETVPRIRLDVILPEEIASGIPAEKLDGLLDILAEDPRPSYQNDPARIYGVLYAGMNVRFRVSGSTLTVTEVTHRG